MAEKGRNETIITNRKARHNYHILEEFTAGLSLTGTEVKSLRQGKANLQEAYCYVEDGEAFIKNMHISEYAQGSYNNHEPTRERKLLLKKKEITKINKQLDQKGLTLVPLKIFFNARNFAKMNVGLAKGKKLYDKREDLKDKDTKRELDRAFKSY